MTTEKNYSEVGNQLKGKHPKDIVTLLEGNLGLCTADDFNLAEEILYTWYEAMNHDEQREHVLEMIDKVRELSVEAIRIRLRAKERARLEEKYCRKLKDAELDAIIGVERQENRNCADCARGDNVNYSQWSDSILGYCPFRATGRPVIELTEAGIRAAYQPCGHWERVMLAARTARAKIPSKYADKTWADYKEIDQNEIAIKRAKEYVAKVPKKSMYLYGGCGTGKTFLATLVAKDLIAKGKIIYFIDIPELLSNLKKNYNDPMQGLDESELAEKCSRADLLILDDVGAGYMTDWAVNIVYEIINERYKQEKPMIITSNLGLRELGERFRTKDAYSGKRTISRLMEMCVPVHSGERDLRQVKF